MSEQDVEFVRRSFLGFSQDFAEFSAGGIGHLPRFWAEDLEIDNVDGWPLPGVYRGYDGWRRWISDAFGEMRNPRPRDVRFVDTGRAVVILGEMEWLTPGDVSIAHRFATVVERREDGLIHRMRVFLDWARALAEGGAPDHPAAAEPVAARPEA